MSRIGKLPINIDSKVNVTIENSFVTIKSGPDEVNYKLNNCVDAVIEDNQLKLKASSASVPKATMFVGLDRSNLNNIITGFINPFKTILEVNGVGYKFIINQKRINFSLGYSHEIIYILPDLVNAQFEKPNMLILTSRSKDLLGKVASEIMSFRKTEPYKGKGIKIKNSFTRRKDGKKIIIMNKSTLRRLKRVRSKIKKYNHGNRPIIYINISNRNISAQLIDCDSANVLVHASSTSDRTKKILVLKLHKKLVNYLLKNALI